MLLSFARKSSQDIRANMNALPDRSVLRLSSRSIRMNAGSEIRTTSRSDSEELSETFSQGMSLTQARSNLDMAIYSSLENPSKGIGFFAKLRGLAENERLVPDMPTKHL
jgi:hypothetical protein